MDEPVEDQGNGTVPDKEVIPYKVHLRGLDTFNPDDVKSYLAEHYGTGQLNRIEWINDTSANFIFKSETAAQEALVALAAVEIADVTQLPPLEEIPAKSFSQKPECALQVRFAVATDKKAAGAAERSRFYLLHPEYDPEERRRRGEFSRDKYRDRDERYRRDRRGDRRDDRRRDAREAEDQDQFDVNLYDDDTTALERRTRRYSRSRPRSRRRSVSSGSSDAAFARRNRDKELFPEKLSGGGHRLRDRSASPARDRDGDAEMDLDQDARAAAALRSREKARSIRERLSRDSSAKELFPSKDNSKKELFPSKVSSQPTGKAQMDQISDTAVLASGMLRLSLAAKLAEML